VKCKRELLFTLLVFLLLFLPGVLYPQSTSSESITISRTELEQLNQNLLKLSLLSQTLNSQIVGLTTTYNDLYSQSQDLKSKKETLEKQLALLDEELMNLRTQLETSLKDLEASKEQVAKLELSYSNLSQSFKEYQKEVGKEIARLKAWNFCGWIVSAAELGVIIYLIFQLLKG